jgi:hypothetical protein
MAEKLHIITDIYIYIYLFIYYADPFSDGPAYGRSAYAWRPMTKTDSRQSNKRIGRYARKAGLHPAHKHFQRMRSVGRTSTPAVKIPSAQLCWLD